MPLMQIGLVVLARTSAMILSPGLALNPPILLQKQPGTIKLLCSHPGCDHFTQHGSAIVALFNGARQPVKRSGFILFNTPALCINQPHAILRIHIALRCRL